VVIECAKTEASCTQSVAMTRRGGRLVMNGLPAEPVEVPWSKAVSDEIDMLGVRANPNTSVPAPSLIADWAVKVGPILSHTISHPESDTGLATLVARCDGATKVVMLP
jgi:threonine dehydrogenase-like Zn-dependent dehydrogenase